MSFMTAFFYDRFMANIEEACIREWRHELLGQVSGEVLEIGAGTGANIKHYSDRVTKLVLTEPDEYMRKRLMPQVNSHDLRNIHVMGGKAEIIEADDESFDYVVASTRLLFGRRSKRRFQGNQTRIKTGWRSCLSRACCGC